jgi:hypothetical protein
MHASERTRPARPADAQRAIPAYYLTRRATMWEDALRRPRRLPSPGPAA